MACEFLQYCTTVSAVLIIMLIQSTIYYKCAAYFGNVQMEEKSSELTKNCQDFPLRVMCCCPLSVSMLLQYNELHCKCMVCKLIHGYTGGNCMHAFDSSKISSWHHAGEHRHRGRSTEVHGFWGTPHLEVLFQVGAESASLFGRAHNCNSSAFTTTGPPQKIRFTWVLCHWAMGQAKDWCM